MDSNVDSEKNKQSRPLISIFAGLFLCVLLSMVFGLALMFAFIFATGFTVSHGNLEPYLLASPAYLTLSIVLTVPALTLAGYIATSFVPTNEVKYGFIISLLLTLISIYLWMDAGSFQKYPVWYSILSLLIPTPCLFIGSRLRAKARERI